MSAISLAITQLFTAFTVLFTAFEKIAKTADNLASVAEESSGAYMDQARVQRAQKLAALNAESATQAAQLKATAPTA